MRPGSPVEGRSGFPEHLQRRTLLTGVVAAAFDQIAGGNEKLTPFGGDHRAEQLQVLRHPGVAAEIRLCGKWTGNARITPCRQTEMGIADHGKPK